MKVIEFCGNPGCGKTTIANDLVSELLKNDYKAFAYNQIKPKKYLYFRNILHFGSVKNIMKLFLFGEKADLKKRVLYSVKIIAVLDQLEKWERGGRVDFVIFEEGIIQYLSTLSHENLIKERDLRFPECLKALYQNNDTLVVDCRLDLSENIKRIQARNRAGDRFLSEEDEKQKNLLCLKRQNLDRLVKYFEPVGLLRINTEDSSAQVISKILLSL